MLAIKNLLRPLILVAMSAVLTGCDDPVVKESDTSATQVAVKVIQPQALTVTETLPGRVNAWRTAEIRPQVSGVIQRRLFEQGVEVKKGDPLFQINAAPFEAEVANAQAGLLRAQAASDHAQQQAARLLPLMKSQAVSRQSYDDAVANARQAAADVDQAKATLRRRQLDLSFATVDAPISGRIDQTLVSEGAYVTASDATPMARLYQTDPIYIDVYQPAETYRQLRRQAASQQFATTGVPVQILLPDGTHYHHPGKILFSGIAVDTGTGEVMVRIEVSNADRELLPGMFVRVQIPRKHYDHALMVPQQAISREGEKSTLWIVNDQQRARQLSVRVGEYAAGAYRIAEGLAAGSRVVVQGMEKLRYDLPVGSVIRAASPLSLSAQAGE